MKGGQNLRDLQAQQRVEEAWCKPMMCIVCHEKMKAPYGRWGSEGGTCSKVCNDKQAEIMKEKIHASILSRKAGGT